MPDKSFPKVFGILICFNYLDLPFLGVWIHPWYVFVCVFVFSCLCLCMHLCHLCMHVCVCAWMYVCLCMCVNYSRDTLSLQFRWHKWSHLSSRQPGQISNYVTIYTYACLWAPHKVYFIKMASLQRTVQTLFRGGANWKQYKYNTMNIWDYFGQEAKKNGLLAKCAQKIPKAISTGFQQ